MAMSFFHQRCGYLATRSLPSEQRYDVQGMLFIFFPNLWPISPVLILLLLHKYDLAGMPLGENIPSVREHGARPALPPFDQGFRPHR